MHGIKNIEWLGNKIRLIDQTKLPTEELYIEIDSLDVLADAIIKLKVRGAPALGVAAAYGILLGTQTNISFSKEKFLQSFENSAALIARTRPTAKNLFWALERMRTVLRQNNDTDTATLFEKLKHEALALHVEDEVMCLAIGNHGAELVPMNATIITHCNTGALATGGIGTAQAVITTAHEQKKNIRVFADETRPLLQGARLTVWELQKAGVDVTLICDNTAAFVMQKNKIDLVVVGADRIAANGDTANKIGTYNLAVIAQKHGVPFYIAAPTSTIDSVLQSGKEILIEERSADEVVNGFGKQTAPNGVKVFSPAFDVTPNEFISAIITEKGILRPPFVHSIASIL